MVYFEDNTNRKKKTAALLLYTQLEHDNHLSGATPSLTGIWFVYYYVVFQAALCFLSRRAVPTAVFDKQVFYLHLL